MGENPPSPFCERGFERDSDVDAMNRLNPYPKQTGFCLGACLFHIQNPLLQKGEGGFSLKRAKNGIIS